MFPKLFSWFFVVSIFVNCNSVFALSDSKKIDIMQKEMELIKKQFQSMMKEINDLKKENADLKTAVDKSHTMQMNIQERLNISVTSDEALPEGSTFIKHTVNPFGLRVSASATGVLQCSAGNNPQDTTNAEGSFDLVFEGDVCEGGMFLIDIEAVENDGPDSVLGTYSGLNDDAGSTDRHVDVLEAWYEQTLFDDKFVFTVGLIDISNYFDTNEVANDETTQFLASAFVNSNVFDAPGNGMGIRGSYSFTEWLDLHLGLQSGDEDGDFVFDRVFFISGLDFHTNFFGKSGNYRMYLSVHGDRHDAHNSDENDESVGFGFSIDQTITDKITTFARLGFRDDQAAESETEWAWSTGIQIAEPFASRPNDMIGVAIGQTQPNREVVPNLKRTTFDYDSDGNEQNDYMASIETLTEMYYSFQVSEKFTVTPLMQLVFQPSGDAHEDAMLIGGIRGQFDF
ncbi:carbohydrate porin [bacterium]|nr:carbohydrate porin [bacterium]